MAHASVFLSANGDEWPRKAGGKWKKRMRVTRASGAWCALTNTLMGSPGPPAGPWAQHPEGQGAWGRSPDPTLAFVSVPRTKWKRQTAVGLELLAEAGNYSALQRMFPSPYFYPQSLVSNLDPGAALYLYRGPSAPPPALQRPLVPRILLHGLQGAGEPPPLPPLAGVLPRAAQPR